jgi:uncharacterized protein
METAFVSLIAYGVYSLTARLALTFMLAMHDGAKTLSAAQIQAYGAAYIVASPLTIAVLWIAIRMARRDFAEYLALNWPSSGELLARFGDHGNPSAGRVLGRICRRCGGFRLTHTQAPSEPADS